MAAKAAAGSEQIISYPQQQPDKFYFKVKGENRYLIFFKAPDTDAMNAAFKEYTAKVITKEDRPSVLAKLEHFKALIKNAVVDRTKRKELER